VQAVQAGQAQGSSEEQRREQPAGADYVQQCKGIDPVESGKKWAIIRCFWVKND
jgi:hypothetical protein